MLSVVWVVVVGVFWLLIFVGVCLCLFGALFGCVSLGVVLRHVDGVLAVVSCVSLCWCLLYLFALYLHLAVWCCIVWCGF